MEPLSKKEIRTKVKESVAQVLENLEITKASKKTKQVIKETSSKITKALGRELKKLAKRNKKVAIKNISRKKSVKAKGKTKVAVEAPVDETKIAS